MTELDLQELGIWWIPLSLPGMDPRATVNAWAIEDDDQGVALFDCGLDTPESFKALESGLARLGATIRDVRRVVLSHAHAEHAGGLRRLVARAAPGLQILASAPERRRLGTAPDLVHDLRDAARLRFRHFEARALHMPGHTAGLTCLFVEREELFFSSDHLLHDVMPIPLCGLRADALDSAFDLRAYGASLARLHGLDVRVVLPGRGPPFAGHRRVVREVIAALGLGTARRAPRSANDAEMAGMAALRRLA